MEPLVLTRHNSTLFLLCNSAKSVTIGSGVTRIESGAFRGCSVLKDIYCHAEAVPSIPTSQDTMDGPPFEWWHYENTTLHVPAASVNAYKTAREWKEFKKIVSL